MTDQNAFSVARSRRSTIGLFQGALGSVLIGVFLVSLVLPVDTSFHIGPLRLTPYRALLILLLAPCIFYLLSGRLGQIRAVDYLVLLHSLWGGLTLFLWGGLSQGLEPAGIFAIETLGSYLLARACVRSSADFRGIYTFAYMLILVMLPFVVFEAVSGQHVLRDAFRSLSGGDELAYDAVRLGLYRALGPFDHPILFGVFTAGLFGGTFYALGGGRMSAVNLLRCGVVALLTFFSLSSGPLVALAAQLCVILWDKMSRRLSNRWWIFLGLLVLGYLFIDLISDRTPFHVLVSYLTLDPSTAYSRITIWIYGWAEVVRHPLFGIGLGDWQRPAWLGSSIDNFWLVEAMRHGLLAAGLLAVAVLWLGWRLSRTKFPLPQLRNCRMAWIATMVGLCVVGGTVHLWNATFCLFFFFLGSGVWLLDTKQPAYDLRARPTSDPSHRLQSARPSRR